MRKTLLLIISCFMLSCEETTVSPSTPSPSGSDADVILLMSIQNDPFTSVVTRRIQPTINLKSLASSATYPSVDAGTVSVNNIVLKKIDLTGSYTYQDSTNLINAIPMNWNIAGSSSFPALSFVDSGSGMPTFSNYSQLPDTIKRVNGFTFVLSNLVNSNVTEFKLYPGTSSEVSVTAVNGIITLSPSQLTSLPTSNFATISVKCTRTTPFDISANGKIIRFTYTSIYSKYGIVVQ